jgi:hypothetical protein
MYARVRGHTPLFLVQTFVGDYRTYAMQIVDGRTQDYIDVRYFLEYSLDNT